MITLEKARTLRQMIVRMSAELSDADAFGVAELFPAWDGNGKAYEIGNRVQYESILYKCLQSHTSQEDWTPGTATSLWVRVDDPAIEWPEWRQPSGSTDAYMAGDKVTYQERHWISDVDNNVWIPGVYGWTEAE